MDVPGQNMAKWTNRRHPQRLRHWPFNLQTVVVRVLGAGYPPTGLLQPLWLFCPRALLGVCQGLGLPGAFTTPYAVHPQSLRSRASRASTSVCSDNTIPITTSKSTPGNGLEDQ